MPAPSTARARDARILNDLRRGTTYRASTRCGVTIGEYLGIETPHGQRAILLRHGRGTASIAVSDVMTIIRAA